MTQRKTTKKDPKWYHISVEAPRSLIIFNIDDADNSGYRILDPVVVTNKVSVEMFKNSDDPVWTLEKILIGMKSQMAHSTNTPMTYWTCTCTPK